MELLSKLHEIFKQTIISESISQKNKSLTVDDRDVLEDAIYGVNAKDQALVKKLRWLKKRHPEQYEKLKDI